LSSRLDALLGAERGAMLGDSGPRNAAPAGCVTDGDGAIEGLACGAAGAGAADGGFIAGVEDGVGAGLDSRGAFMIIAYLIDAKIGSPAKHTSG
jgi:hypothetical protein